MLQNLIRTLIVLVAVSLVGGCEKPPAPPAEPPAPKPPAEAIGSTAVCLLCDGHEIEVKTTTPFSIHEGVAYYFCSKGCKQRFDSDPTAAIAKQMGATTQPTTLPTTRAVAP